MGPPSAGGGPGGGRPDGADVADPPGLAAGGRGARAGAARPVARAARAVAGAALRHLRDPDAGSDARPVAGQRLRLADPLALLRRHPLRPGAGRADRVLPRGPTRAGAAHPHRRSAPVAGAGRAGAGDVPPRGPRRLVRADVRPAALVPPRAAGRPEEHPRLGPGDRRGPQPGPGPLHLPEPGGRRGPRVPDRVARHGTRPQRRLRDLPRGRQLHRRAARPRDRQAPQARPGEDGGARRGDGPRPGAPPRRRTGRARCRARGRRADGRPHRARPPADRRRPVARAADGQADHHALVAGGPRGDPGRPRGAHRVALQLVGAHRRLDRDQPRRRLPDVPPSADERWPTHLPSRPKVAQPPPHGRHAVDATRAVPHPRVEPVECGWDTARCGAAGAASSCGARRRCRSRRRARRGRSAGAPPRPSR